MAKVRVMYWKEVPAQVQAEDESSSVSRPLNDRFQKGFHKPFSVFAKCCFHKVL